MKRCLLVILDDDYNEHYVEELKPEYETTLRCDGEIWIASYKLKDGGAKMDKGGDEKK